MEVRPLYSPCTPLPPCPFRCCTREVKVIEIPFPSLPPSLSPSLPPSFPPKDSCSKSPWSRMSSQVFAMWHFFFTWFYTGECSSVSLEPSHFYLVHELRMFLGMCGLSIIVQFCQCLPLVVVVCTSLTKT